MATSRMLPHTATIFVEIGRDEHYQTKYAVHVLRRVYCQTGKSYQGGTPCDPLTVYIFDTSTKGFGTLKLKAAGNEYIVPYDAGNSTRPPMDARVIRSVHRRKAGSPRMWHWKVDAE